MKPAAALLALLLGADCAATHAAAPQQAAKAPRLFKHSDVIAFTTGTLEEYRDYRVDFVSWGGYPADEKAKESFRKRIDEARAVGTRIGAQLGTRTSSTAFMDFASPERFMDMRCIEVDGTPLITPHEAAVRHRGHPAYWFCTNSPLFHEFLKRNAERAIDCGPFGIMMDDPAGTAGAVAGAGACYCKFCVEQFRAYLKQRYSPAELAAKGVADPDHFDLREFHSRFAKLKPSDRPLRAEILDFQERSSAAMFTEVMAHALRYAGKKIPVSANVTPTCYYGRFILPVDYFNCECHMDAQSGSLDQSWSFFTFKAADALRRPAAICGSGTDHAFIEEHQLPGMVRCWVAEAYASGNYFDAPFRLWASSKKRESYSYRPRDKSELAPLYQFVKRHADLLDDYEPVARVALIDSRKAFRRRWSKPTFEAAVRLADLNVPFELVIAGDECLPVRLNPQELARFETLLLVKGSKFEEPDAAALDAYRRAGGQVVSAEEFRDAATRIRFEGADRVRAVLRAVPGDSRRPAVLHLLNRDYDLPSDGCRPKTDFAVRVPRALLGGRAIRRAEIVASPRWAPKAAGDAIRSPVDVPRAALTPRADKDFVELRVPRLDCWAIVVLWP